MNNLILIKEKTRDNFHKLIQQVDGLFMKFNSCKCFQDGGVLSLQFQMN